MVKGQGGGGKGDENGRKMVVKNQQIQVHLDAQKMVYIEIYSYI